MTQIPEPEKVLHFFQKISEIPHGSGNEKAISDYLYSFGKERGLWVMQDEFLNIIIKKPASPDKEGCEPIILQSHMDMVCEKNEGTLHNFKTDPLKLYREGDFLKAHGTTLGADNGVGLAMSLAVLDGDYSHPPLEIVVTTNEEVGLCGARDLDARVLESKRLINLDSGREGEFCISCAGGVKVYLHLPIETMDLDARGYEPYILKVYGLNGGHSGMEINKGLGNSIRILSRALDVLRQEFDFFLWDIHGGLADNAIPREAQASLILPVQLIQAIEGKVKELEDTYRRKYRINDAGLCLRLEKGQGIPKKVFTPDFFRKTLAAALLLPNGVEAMSAEVPGLVETSNNLGIIGINQDKLELVTAVRSSVVSDKYALRDRIMLLADVLEGSAECKGDYPSWEHNPESAVRELFRQVYEKRYGEPPEITAVHAGLECGYFAEKIPGIDMIALGPEIIGAHTPEERLSIPSLQRTWGLLVEALSLL